jgi:hypothetical protein
MTTAPSAASTRELPPTAAEYLHMVNTGDAPGFARLFAPAAIVEDNGRRIDGHAAVAAWAASDIFAVNVRLELLDASQRNGAIVLKTKVDGDFDRTGLPNPLVMEHELRTADNRITFLTCRLA